MAGIDSPPSRRARATRRPRIVVLILVILLGALGGAVLWKHQTRQLAEISSRGVLRQVADAATCFTSFAPHNDMEVTLLQKNLTDRLETDDEGFRTDAAIQHPANPRCRFLAVGDSFTEGSLVLAHEAFPHQLEVVLQEKGYSVRVDNGAGRGHTIHQERIAALGRWPHIKHDGVILGITGGNDLIDLNLLQRNGCEVGGTIPTSFEPLDPVALNDASVGKALLVKSLKSFLEDRPVGGADDLSPAQCDSLATEYQKILVTFARELKARQQSFMVVQFESFACNYKGDWFRQDLSDGILPLAASEGAVTTDVRAILWSQGMTLLPADRHPSAAGHRSMAEAIASNMIAQHVVDRCRE
jgi:lysophospholipase L1-like esterase